MKFRTFFYLAICGFLASCAPSTQLEKSWTDPSFTKETAKPFKKVLVVASLKDDQSKRIAEDKIVKAIKNGVAVQSYTYLKSTDTDQKQLEDNLRKDGFDGIIVMRLTDINKSVSYNPGSSYGGWYGYRYASPGYYSEDQTFLVETNIYSLVSNKLIWSGTTSSLNPTKFEQTIDDIIATIKYNMKNKGLIK